MTGVLIDRCLLEHSNFSNASINEINLHGTVISGKSFVGSIYGGKIQPISPLQIFNLRWEVTIYMDRMRIGCKSFTHDKWNGLTSAQIESLDFDALPFWKENRNLLLGLCRNHNERCKAIIEGDPSKQYLVNNAYLSNGWANL